MNVIVKPQDPRFRLESPNICTKRQKKNKACNTTGFGLKIKQPSSSNIGSTKAKILYATVYKIKMRNTQIKNDFFFFLLHMELINWLGQTGTPLSISEMF